MNVKPTTFSTPSFCNLFFNDFFNVLIIAFMTPSFLTKLEI